MKEKLLTTREVSHMLGIPEKDIIDLANADLLPHFKVGGAFLRFRQDDILKVKENIKKKYNLPEKKIPGVERIREFFYFNDFYIVSTMAICALLWVIFKDYRS
ncbi:MAG: helix-turn-helix domain-containing protein [Candidatus Omnitrophota bacterium]|nr:helix-turn-helix domain-containing protein [Candidatus Omnitrophota bacterium]